MHTTFSKALVRVRAIPQAAVRWPRWVRWIAIAVAVLLVAAGGFGIYKVRQTQAAAAAEPALQTSVARQGDLTLMASGTGTLIASEEVDIGFKTSGLLTTLNVKVGDQVKAGDVLAVLDDSTQQTALAQAKQALLELTSDSAIATAQEAVATDQQAVYNAQASLNNLLYASTNAAAIQNAKASLTLAQDDLARAQAAYSKVSGNPDKNVRKAMAYQQLYTAQLNYNSSVLTYNLLTGKANQAQVDLKTAALALAKATLVEDQIYLAALTGGEVPEDASGSGYQALQQAKLAVQTAQEDLDNTKLVAPISGTVMSISNQVGESVGSGTFITIADLSHADIQIYMDESDWSNIKIGYEAQVTFDALPDQIFTGKVIQVYPALVSTQGSSVVEGLVQLDQATDASAADPITQLPLGVTASVDVISAQVKNVVLVPIQALHQLSTDSYGVFVMVNGTPTLKVVEVGLQSDTFAEIKSGIQAGDVVSTGIQATTK
jgi:multidrug efflux pump subunit AcrA (membrane-fusion protein)